MAASLYKGVCFDSTEAAQQAFLSDHAGLAGAIQSGQVSAVSWAASDAGGGSYVLTVNGAASSGPLAPVSHSATYPAFPACSYAGDPRTQLEYFSLVLAFLTVVWAATVIKNKFWRQHDPF